MTRPQIPGRDEVLGALARLQADAQASGRQPSALALARSLGLANTTFRRNFPDIAAQLTRHAAARQQMPAPPSRYAQLQQSDARLRSEHRELREQLEVAAAVIQRITTENHRLRRELEAAANTQITHRLQEGLAGRHANNSFRGKRIAQLGAKLAHLPGDGGPAQREDSCPAKALTSTTRPNSPRCCSSSATGSPPTAAWTHR